MFGLTLEQYNLFITVHAKHMQSMDEKHKSNYALENVIKVEWIETQNYLKVHYEREWLIYDRNHNFY